MATGVPCPGAPWLSSRAGSMPTFPLTDPILFCCGWCRAIRGRPARQQPTWQFVTSQGAKTRRHHRAACRSAVRWSMQASKALGVRRAARAGGHALQTATCHRHTIGLRNVTAGTGPKRSSTTFRGGNGVLFHGSQQVEQRRCDPRLRTGTGDLTARCASREGQRDVRPSCHFR